MHLDTLTLMAAGSFVTAVCAVLLFVAWAQVRSPALLWWASSKAASAIAVGVLAYGMGSGNRLAVLLAVAGLNVSPPLVWAGVMRFNHRKQPYVLLFAGPLLWLATLFLPLGGLGQTSGQVLGFAFWVTYLAAASVDLWRGGGEPLAARWPLIGFLVLHALVFLGGVVDTLAGTMPEGVIPPLSSWFSMIHFETLIFEVGSSVFMVLMVKERSERGHIFAARHDSLTGIANRGAFLHGGERLLRRCQAEARSCSLIMFDLDAFKRINDSFGHDVGDDVLRAFADTTLSLLRPSDLFGRLGGEEFVVLLPGATIEAAYVIAERIRYRFAALAVTLNNQTLNATVSAGVATADSDTALEVMLRAADRALYRAKDLGRNRVERAASERQPEAAKIIRIA